MRSITFLNVLFFSENKIKMRISFQIKLIFKQTTKGDSKVTHSYNHSIKSL